MDKEKLATNADWTPFIKRPSWSSVTSIELANILGVSIANINQWKLRGHLPSAEPRIKGKGNKNRYRISKIKHWLYGTPEDDIHWRFIQTHMHEEFTSIEQAMLCALTYWKAFEIEKPV